MFGRLIINNNDNSKDSYKNIHNNEPLKEDCSSPEYKMLSEKYFIIKIRSLSDCYVGYFDDI